MTAASTAGGDRDDESWRGDGPLPQALLVVDLQEDFFSDPELSRRRRQLIDCCNGVIAAARRAGVPVFEIRTVHAPDKSSWSLNMLRDDEGMTIEATEGARPLGELTTRGAVVVEKTRDSAFHGTSLAESLDDAGITSIALCGVSTESCIAMTAAEAYARDLHVTLIADALASVDPQAHYHALDRLSRQYRQTVVSSDRLRFDEPDRSST